MRIQNENVVNVKINKMLEKLAEIYGVKRSQLSIIHKIIDFNRIQLMVHQDEKYIYWLEYINGIDKMDIFEVRLDDVHSIRIIDMAE